MNNGGSFRWPTASMPSFLKTLLLGLRLAVLRAPNAAELIRPGVHFWLLLILQVLSTALIAWFYAPADYRLDPMGVQSDAFLALLTLASAVIALALLKRPVLSWSLAVLWMAAGLWISWVLVLVDWLLLQGGVTLYEYPYGVRTALLIWWLAMVWRSLHAVPAVPWRRVVAAVLAAGISALPALLLPLTSYFQAPPLVANAALIDLPAVAEDADLEWPLRRSPEQLLAAQPALLSEALGRLQPQDPDRVDAYLLAFGGDGSETVFKNEVEYALSMFAQRFAMQGRTLGLLNHPSTTADLPLATLTNLRAALAGIGEVMDPEQDLLILFMTSHGSEEHELYVDLLGLPLDQINPDQLQEALRESGITWKVAVVSACYSGGFIEALGDSTTLVITAARADRPSFGCGVDSDFTYFGRALLIEALNQTSDLLAAFEIAKERVSQREAEEDLDPSHPQLHSSALVEAKLEGWRQQLQPGPALPFAPAELE